MKFALSPQAKSVFVKRVKSFMWRVGAMIAVMVVDFAMQNLGLFDIPISVSVVLGLALGELSKFLRSNLKELHVDKSGVEK